MSIYADIILDHYRSTRYRGKIKQADTVCHVTNPLCGDKIDFSAVIKQGIVDEIRFEGEGCAISLASASIISQWATGKKIDEVVGLKPDAFIRMLGIELSPNRMKCALLAIEGVHALFSKKGTV